MSASDFRDALLELIDSSPKPMGHPSPDDWLAYHRGELPAGEEERLQEHLARCRDCFDLAAAAAAFAQGDEATDADGETESAALWRLLRPQPDPRLQPSRNVREIAAVPRRRPSGRNRLPMALAASFFVALIGLSAWSLRQQRALEALRTPKADVPIFEVAADERALAGPEPTVQAGPRMLVLHPAEELPVYRLVIRDAASAREVSSTDLRPNRDLALVLYLPEGLPRGRYRLELSDGSGGRRGRLVETHLLRVE
jgi:anti-sigma factor RsiW